ncbi:MAG: D-sedoheptulose 7-phosphate isomerase [Deltaproteobacteria bacterium]|nr:D-sedoheptulose 7-phosphate isomerase [Deltaproteobacteria bacterium]
MGEAKRLFKAAVEELLKIADEPYAERIDLAVEAIVNCYISGGKLLVFGNGGSAADAQHIAGELVGRFKQERKALSAIALTTDTSILTAWSNDYGFESVFSRQVEAHGRPNDIAWGITTSGNSPNVVTALSRARELGLKTIAMTGAGGGRSAEHADILLAVSSKDTPRVQEAHEIGYHIICRLVEERLFG